MNYQTIQLDAIDILEQARKEFDQAELSLLGANIREHGLLVPILVKKAGERFALVAGERRVRAMLLVGITSCEAIVLQEMDGGDTEVVQWIENAHRTDLKPAEKAAAIRSIKEKKSWTNKQVAEHLHIDPSLVGRYLSLFETIPAAQQAAAESKLAINSWYAISRQAPEEQAEMLAMFLTNMPATQVISLTRKPQNGTVPSKKKGSGAPTKGVTKITCPIPGTGRSVVFMGEAITLDDMIASMNELVAEAKKASKRGLDVKTFERMCQDLAKSFAGVN